MSEINYERAYERFIKSRPGFWRHLNPREKFSQVAYEQRIKRERLEAIERDRIEYLEGSARPNITKRRNHRGGVKSRSFDRVNTISEMNSQGLYSMTQISKMLGISQSTISKKVSEGVLVPVEKMSMKFLKIDDVKASMKRCMTHLYEEGEAVKLPAPKMASPQDRMKAVERNKVNGFVTANWFSKQHPICRKTLQKLVETGRISYVWDSETLFVNEKECVELLGFKRK